MESFKEKLPIIIVAIIMIAFIAGAYYLLVMVKYTATHGFPGIQAQLHLAEYHLEMSVFSIAVFHRNWIVNGP